MQVLKDNTRNGEILIQIDSLDDLWVLYNIIQEGDQVKGRTVRRVVLREGDPGVRKPMTLLTSVEKVEFHEFTNRLRILGAIIEGPEDWVSTGQHHTFNLEPGQQIWIFKEQWYRHDIQRIRRSIEKKDATMMMCVALESGLANVALLSNYSLTPITEVKANIPGKRYKQQAHKESVSHFYENVLKVIEENVVTSPISLIIVCGPGFEKEHFAEFYAERQEKAEKKCELRAVNASSGELSAIYEILRNGSLAVHKADFKLAQDEMLMTKFVEFMGKDEGMVVYGLDQVYLAAQMGAVESLLICDVLLRTSDKAQRQKIEEALNLTEQNRGTVHILSTLNPAGEQLESYGKIAAILRYRTTLQ